MKEVELLFKIKDDNQAQIIRERPGQFFVKKFQEVDTYFYPPNRDFTVSGDGRENLRVRKNELKQELTYKKVFYNQGVYSHSIEKNVSISDVPEMIEILKVVGFRVHFVIDKEREVFDEAKFHITLDKVKDLGTFLEIEWRGEVGDNDIEKVKQFCLKRARELGLENIQDKGYLRLLEERADL